MWIEVHPDFTFISYKAENKAACLAIFDQNCPRYFAPNERADYESFLNETPKGYECCVFEGTVVAAYGLIVTGSTRGSLNWIMISPQAQGRGIGAAIMERVFEEARRQHLELIDIAASHHSMGFFAKYGAQTVKEQIDGWGPHMHRVDMELRQRDNKAV